MEQDQIEYESLKMKNPLDYPSEGSRIFELVFNFILIVVSIIVAVWFIGKIAEIGGGAWWLVVIAAVLGLIITTNQITTNSTKRKFFDNPDNHTHDDNCHTCGRVYGPPPASGIVSAYIYRMAYVCRHASGEMKYPE